MQTGPAVLLRQGLQHSALLAGAAAQGPALHTPSRPTVDALLVFAQAGQAQAADRQVRLLLLALPLALLLALGERHGGEGGEGGAAAQLPAWPTADTVGGGSAPAGLGERSEAARRLAARPPAVKAAAGLAQRR